MENKIDIRFLSLDELKAKMTMLGEKPFRAKQVFEWLWKKSAFDFQGMSNLSKDLRLKLEQHFIINHISIDLEQHSEDGTIKVRFKLFDGHLIEGVLIPTDDRLTACISSQVGCSLACKFCATGYLKRQRNLKPDEIYDQVVLLNQLALQHHNKPLTNIVFMGMGEPLLNYTNVLKGIEAIHADWGLNISNRRITLSTAGIAKMIRKLADDKVKFNLALSLHATTDEQRNKIMPINEHNNLQNLVEALNYFYEHTHNKITFEYILLNGINESLQDAERLVQLCRKVPAKINIIEYNAIEQARFTRSRENKREKFIQYLEKKKVTATLRKSRGKDIDAACGQLANK
jgi:23S rRNA (adenine2503-C2)-methyltransferase